MAKEYESLTNELQEKINEYLTDLRDSGRVNMFAAPRMLESMFGLSRLDALRAFLAWAETFDKD